MSCTTAMCNNSLCGFIGFTELEICPECGGTIHNMWDEEGDKNDDAS